MHEALSGVSAAADAIARAAVDLPSCVVMAVVFALPLDGMTTSPVGPTKLVGLFFLTGWAYSSLGYLFSMLTPSSAPVSTAACSLFLAIFAAGCFGFHPIDVVEDPGLLIMAPLHSLYTRLLSSETAQPTPDGPFAACQVSPRVVTQYLPSCPASGPTSHS